MITRRLAIGGLLAALAGNARAAAPAFRPLQSGSFDGLVAARRNQPFLLVLWSITCGPCRDEFALLREMRKRYPQLPLVLISTDDLSDEAMAAKALQDFAMAGEENWLFADDAQKLRYEIDPGWYGELPRAYFYAASHSREGISGALARERIEAWIRAEKIG
ncbi:MAG: TlpA family protein disulfide reductase [Chromatiales bacterium]|nr:TlpA family protein disulfide reductase [Chromatiales bacterium]